MNEGYLDCLLIWLLTPCCDTVLFQLVQWCCESTSMDSTEDAYYSPRKQLYCDPLQVYTPQTSVTQKSGTTAVNIVSTAKLN